MVYNFLERIREGFQGKSELAIHAVTTWVAAVFSFSFKKFLQFLKKNILQFLIMVQIH